MRLDELFKLLLTDIDWDRSHIRVFGKGAKERYVPFTREAKKAVWRYLSYRHDDHPVLWVTEERRPAGRWTIVSATQSLIKRAGLHGQIKDMHHIFRRSWAMRNLKAGVPIKYVQLIGGWESVTTLEQYVRAMESEDALDANWV
jgi:site-specific recombinase XerD